MNRISIAHLTGEKIKDIDFIVPSIEEQTQIVQHIETETARINAKAEKTKKLIKYFKIIESKEIVEISKNDVEFEENLKNISL